MTGVDLHRGDVVLVPFPFSDLTASKVRPAIIVSAEPQGSEIIVAFVTSVLTNHSHRGAEVLLMRDDPEFIGAKLKTDSLVRLDKLVTLSRHIVTRRLGSIGPRIQSQINEMLFRSLGLSVPV